MMDNAARPDLYVVVVCYRWMELLMLLLVVQLELMLLLLLLLVVVLCGHHSVVDHNGDHVPLKEDGFGGHGGGGTELSQEFLLGVEV